MLSSPLSDSIPQNEISLDPKASPGRCQVPGNCTHNHAKVNLRIAMIGGILIVNSFLAQTIFFPNEPFARTLSSFIGAVVLSIPIWFAALKDMKRGKFYMNELVALALLAAFVIGRYQEVGIIAFFMLIAIAIEEQTAIGAKESIEALLKLTPAQARKINGGNGQESLVLANMLKIDDRIRVRPGENFPADGKVEKGESSVNQSSISGESFPVDVEIGSQVYAGTENLTGLLEVKVTAIGVESTLGKVRKLIEEAENSRLPILRMADNYVGYYTPVIVTIALVVWFFTQDLMRVVLILVIACPCALIVATPSAVIAAIAAAARWGILIKNVAHIETASQIDAIVFDKTGTLTTGQLEVACLSPAEGVELTELLTSAAMAESDNNHPVAHAIRKLAVEAKIKWDSPTKVTEFAGKGIEAKLHQDRILVGRELWLKELGIPITENLEKSSVIEKPLEMSMIHIAKNNKWLGWIGFQDKVRTNAKEALESLNKLGIMECCMVTGDNKIVAESVGNKVGIQKIRFDCLPEEKVEYVKKLKQTSRLVAVVGDGINDAPALAAGDIGIAMGAIGSDVAVNSASIALMNNDLTRIPTLISLSRKTRNIIWMNIAFGVSLIIGGLIIFTLGNQFLESIAYTFHLKPSVLKAFFAATFHVGGTLAVFFNSARLIRFGTIQPLK